MLIIDAHLDIAYNVLRGRDVTRPAAAQPVCDNEIATVGLPDLRAGGVGLVCATIFCLPHSSREPGYRTPDEAHAMAWQQIECYRRLEADGQLRIQTNRNDIDSLRSMGVPPMPPHAPVGAIILLEGADPIRNADDAERFYDAGVRIVGLSWKRTAHAGGTGEPGPLTNLGRATVRALDRLGIIHDASHLAEESFWQLIDLATGPVIASHSNCRSIVPGDRHLSDEMIRVIVARGGVIGINFFDKFLVPPDERGERRRATLADVVRHVRHVCDLAGDAAHVGLGSDMDGGLGREQVPSEITTSADLPRVADALSDAGFNDDAVRGIMGGNWLGFFARHLPVA